MTTQAPLLTVKRDYKSRMFVMLFYISDVYSDLTKEANLYSEKLTQIPAPKFIVFYNGIKEQPDYKVFRLSDAYSIQGESISLELVVDMFNINKGHNEELMDACKDLKDYAEYVYRVRKYAKDITIEEAVNQAIDECIQENILKEFLAKNRSEAMAMSIYEYDAEKHRKMERDDAFEDGRKAGAIECAKELLLDILSRFGHLPEDFLNCIQSVDEDILIHWTKTAVLINNLEEFWAKIDYPALLGKPKA